MKLKEFGPVAPPGSSNENCIEAFTLTESGSVSESDGLGQYQ